MIFDDTKSYADQADRADKAGLNQIRFIRSIRMIRVPSSFLRRALHSLSVVAIAGLIAIASSAQGRRIRVTVLVEAGQADAAKRILVSPDVVLAGPGRVGRFSAVRIETTPERIAELSADPTVRVWPWEPPRPHDERSGQMLAGAIDDDGQPTAPGYLAFLASHGLDGPLATLIDVTDSGFDRGSTTDVPFELQDDAGGSRVGYARDFTFDDEPHDLTGHGTLNASIAAGRSTGQLDSGGYDYGLGIAPGARVGSSRIFRNNGSFGLQAFYSNVTSVAWRDGARVTSNSWGSPANVYTPDSTEYDAIVRDSDPETPGNQEMVVVFSAGNFGLGGRIESPATAKNVITVGAAEGVRGGTDGCGAGPALADSVLDVASFSAGGPVDDGRIKPDLVAPGTHVTGTKSRADGYNGDGVCIDGFAGDKSRFTWSSGTSHAAPAVAGAAALLIEHLTRTLGAAPSPALVKAWLCNSTRYLTGVSANDDLPSPRQGWGLVDLGRALDDAPRFVIDQTVRFESSGQSSVHTLVPVRLEEPVRVTLVWSDAPGAPGTAPLENDLDLEVEAAGQVFRGNHFSRDVSLAGGLADSRNTVESVWLPAGVGPLRVRVRGTRIVDDGVPGIGAPDDQDYALVVSNVEARNVPLLRVSTAMVETATPGGEGTVRLTFTNSGNAPAPSGAVALAGGPGVIVLDGDDVLPALAPESAAALARGFRIRVDASVPCGAPLGLVARVGGITIPIAARAGSLVETTLFEDDVEGPAMWTFGTDNRGATWNVVSTRARSGEKSWFVPGATVSGDGYIASTPIAIPATAVDARFEFWHTFELERGFDGGIVEVSDGGPFVDAGVLARAGAYPANVFALYGNPLGTRAAWTGGRLGDFTRVEVDLSPFAGRTIRLRLRVGADARTGGPGWYIDDMRVTATTPECAVGGTLPAVVSASWKNGKLKVKATGIDASTVIAVNGRTVLVPARFVANKGVLKVKGNAELLNLRSGLNVVTVTSAARTSRAFAFAL